MIDEMYNKFYLDKEMTDEKQQLTDDLETLKNNLSKNQRGALLNVIEDIDLIRFSISEDSFKQGIQIGFKLATDVYEYGKEE